MSQKMTVPMPGFPTTEPDGFQAVVDATGCPQGGNYYAQLGCMEGTTTQDLVNTQKTKNTPWIAPYIDN
jgi:hypothetical protein